MPANLTQQYRRAEAAYRRACDGKEILECLLEMLRLLPKHKGTDKLQAELKQKISRAKTELAAAPVRSPSRIPRQGAGRVVLVGGPNAGKSQLVATATRANPLVAPYPFATRDPYPAMMPAEDVLIQLVDTPSITMDVLDPRIVELVRGADLVLLIADLGSDEGIEQLDDVLTSFANSKTRLGRESFLNEDDIGVSTTQTILMLNKADADGFVERRTLLPDFCPHEFDELEVSALDGRGLERLKVRLFEALDVVRVYTKLPDEKEPDCEKPFTIRRGGAVIDLAELIHQDLRRNFKHARIWRVGTHDGAVVKGDFELQDKDIVEVHT